MNQKKNTDEVISELSLFQKVKSQIAAYSIDLATSSEVPLYITVVFLAFAAVTPLFLWRSLLSQF